MTSDQHIARASEAEGQIALWGGERTGLGYDVQRGGSAAIERAAVLDRQIADAQARSQHHRREAAKLSGALVERDHVESLTPADYAEFLGQPAVPGQSMQEAMETFSRRKLCGQHDRQRYDWTGDDRLERRADGTVHRDMMHRAAAAVGQITIDGTTLRGVRIIGLASANGVSYPAAVLAASLAKFSGARVFLNHPDKAGTRNRPVEALAGSVGNVWMDEGGMRGDIVARGPAGDTLLRAAREASDITGFSVHIHGLFRPNADKTETCESITECHSVDLVTVPGATKNMLESRGLSALTIAI